MPAITRALALTTSTAICLKLAPPTSIMPMKITSTEIVTPRSGSKKMKNMGITAIASACRNSLLDFISILRSAMNVDSIIPAHHTDFIFSVVGEELGFIGGMILLALFSILIWRAFKIAASAKDPFGTCLLYTSDAADDLLCVDLGGRRI